jgi:hypothetical protein
MPISVVLVVEPSTRRIGIHNTHFDHGLPLVRNQPSVGVHAVHVEGSLPNVVCTAIR